MSINESQLRTEESDDLAAWLAQPETNVVPKGDLNYLHWARQCITITPFGDVVYDLRRIRAVLRRLKFGTFTDAQVMKDLEHIKVGAASLAAWMTNPFQPDLFA
jgi:hypothetical protein